MKIVIAALACSLVCFSCAKTPYFSDVSSAILPSEKALSFAFMKNEKSNKAIEMVVFNELQRRNYVFDPVMPDLLVSYQTYMAHEKYFFRKKPILAKNKTKAETLVLQMIDLNNGKTIWRGMADQLPVNSLEKSVKYYAYSVINSK